MKKRLCALMIASMMAIPVTAYAGQGMIVMVNGVSLNTEVAPVIENGRTLVPLRAIAEALNVEILWIPESQAILYYNNEGVQYYLTIGNKEAQVGGDAGIEAETITLDAAPKIENGRTLVPLRFIAESLGVSVDFDGDAGVVYVGEKTEKDATAKSETELSPGTSGEKFVTDTVDKGEVDLALAVQNFAEKYKNATPGVIMGQPRVEIYNWENGWLSKMNLDFRGIDTSEITLEESLYLSEPTDHPLRDGVFVYNGAIVLKSKEGEILFQCKIKNAPRYSEVTIEGLRIVFDVDNEQCLFNADDLTSLGIIK